MDDHCKSKTVWMCVLRKPNGQRSQLSVANSSNRRSKGYLISMIWMDFSRQCDM